MKYLILLLMFVCTSAQADYYKVFLQERAFVGDPAPIVVRTLFNCTLDGDDLVWDQSVQQATSYSIFECEGVSNEYFTTPKVNAPNSNYFATFIVDGVELYPLRFHCALVKQFYSRSDNYGERWYDCLPHPIFINGFEKH